MLFQKWLLQYSNSRNDEKWRLAATTEFRVKPRVLRGECSNQQKNILLLRECKILEIGCAPPVYGSFALKCRKKPRYTPEWTEPIKRAYKEYKRATWNAEKSFIWGMLFPWQEGEDYSRCTWNNQSMLKRGAQEIHRKVHKKLRIVEQLKEILLSAQCNPHRNHNYFTVCPKSRLSLQMYKPEAFIAVQSEHKLIWETGFGKREMKKEKEGGVGGGIRFAEQK